MIKCEEAISRLKTYLNDDFDIKLWQEYMDGIIKDSSKLLLDETKGYDFDKQCLPIIQRALDDDRLCQKILDNYLEITADLDDKLISVFKRSVDVKIILYLGLCNGAGWALDLDGEHYILLGIEKIIELDLGDKPHLIDLIYHELGHIYQDQYGAKVDKEFRDKADALLWQLYIEGFAMYFEQCLSGEKDRFHQEKDGYSEYLGAHLKELALDFLNDLLKERPQRYFGDWCDYHGYGDTGYYLGAYFMRYIIKKTDLDRAMDLDIKELKERYLDFIDSL